MQQTKTALREQGGLKQKPEGLKYRNKYTRKFDLEILKRISRQDQNSLVSRLALRIAKSLEEEQRRMRGIQ